MSEHFERYELRKGAQAIIAGCAALNQYFDAIAPWKLAKSEAPADRATLSECVERCLAYLELLSRRIAPACPRAAADLRKMLGEAALPAHSGVWGEESDTRPPARLPARARLGEPTILFPKIEAEAIAAEITALEARASQA